MLHRLWIEGFEGSLLTVVPRPTLSFDFSVSFAFNSPELTGDAKKELDKIIAVLKDPEVKDADVIVSGHTDAKGSEAIIRSFQSVAHGVSSSIWRKTES